MSEQVRILLVDDHLVVRQGLRMLLENHPDLTVVGEAATGSAALDLAARERPHIVLLDLDLGAEQGLDVIPDLASIPGARVLVLTGLRDRDVHRRAIRLGAAGVVLKEQAADLLVKAVRCVHGGEVWVDRSMTAAILQEMRQGGGAAPAADLDAARIAALTAREREIVGLVAQGFGTQKIADTLSISEKTVRNHLASIYDKLNVSERLELALYAARHGLAPSPGRRAGVKSPPESGR